ncbi:unnamed protein product [Rotaria socialis]|uniref:Uncharacterized protein n=1 Tax=Rotaria socialis TaxID=392032 RepID=A0A820INJ8_9BILA|nr:unnamed protein product [Rotaria socialis]CAF4312039.1 unnamed protein product [Rotaria socialis]
MQSTPFSTSTSTPWVTTSNSNVNTNNSSFWSNGGYRKRKAAATDLDEKVNQKMFVTEEKMVKEMRTLSLDLLPPDTNNVQVSADDFVESIVDDVQTNNRDDDDDDDDDDDEKEKCSEETRFELHKLLKESLKNDDLQDSLISKLWEIERKKLTMQLVPYMPIHPAQLHNENVTTDNKTKEPDEEKMIENQFSSSVIYDEEIKNDGHLFKIPSIPTLYTVEEPPCDGVLKRNPTMKRSYSQSNQQNSSLSVTELRPGVDDFSTIAQSQSPYFIVEPSSNALSESPNLSSSSLLSDGPSIRISEVADNPPSNNELSSVIDDNVDDDIDMQSVASSDTGDKMDDE